MAINLSVDRQECARFIGDAARTTLITIELGLLNLSQANFENTSKQIDYLIEEIESKCFIKKKIKTEANVNFIYLKKKLI